MPRHPLAAVYRDELLRRFEELAALGSLLDAGDTELSPEMLRRLRALGYIR